MKPVNRRGYPLPFGFLFGSVVIFISASQAVNALPVVTQVGSPSWDIVDSFTVMPEPATLGLLVPLLLVRLARRGQ